MTGGHYHVAIEAGVNRKAVQGNDIPIPGDTLMCKISWKKKLFDVVHFASNLHLNRFCLVRDFAYLIKKIHKMFKLVS